MAPGGPYATLKGRRLPAEGPAPVEVPLTGGSRSWRGATVRRRYARYRRCDRVARVSSCFVFAFFRLRKVTRFKRRATAASMTFLVAGMTVFGVADAAPDPGARFEPRIVFDRPLPNNDGALEAVAAPGAVWFGYSADRGVPGRAVRVDERTGLSRRVATFSAGTVTGFAITSQYGWVADERTVLLFSSRSGRHLRRWVLPKHYLVDDVAATSDQAWVLAERFDATGNHPQERLLHFDGSRRRLVRDVAIASHASVGSIGVGPGVVFVTVLLGEERNELYRLDARADRILSERELPSRIFGAKPVYGAGSLFLAANYIGQRHVGSSIIRLDARTLRITKSFGPTTSVSLDLSTSGHRLWVLLESPGKPRLYAFGLRSGRQVAPPLALPADSDLRVGPFAAGGRTVIVAVFRAGKTRVVGVAPS